MVVVMHRREDRSGQDSSDVDTDREKDQITGGFQNEAEYRIWLGP